MATAASAAVTHATAVPSTPVRHRSGAWARWIWSVPDLLPIAVAGFSVPQTGQITCLGLRRAANWRASSLVSTVILQDTIV